MPIDPGMLLTALALGLAYAAVPGAVNTEALRRGLAGGFRPAALVETGAIVGDTAWAVVGLGGAAALARFDAVTLALGLVGGGFLLALARSAFLAALRGGAAAHLGKDAGEETLRETIRRVAHGEHVIQQQLLERPQVSGRVVERAGAFGRARPLPRRPPLTARELQVLRGISAGKTNGEIGDELGISAQTVKNHVTAILRKLGVSDRTQAVVLGLRQGWLAMEGIVPPPAAPPGEGE